MIPLLLTWFGTSCLITLTMRKEMSERLAFINEKLISLENDIDDLYETRDEYIDMKIGFGPVQHEINLLLDQRDSLEIERNRLAECLV